MLSADGWLLASSDAPPLRRTASIVRDRRYVADHTHFQSGCRKGTNCRLSSRSGTTHANIHGSHAVIPRLIGGVHSGLLRRERSSFSGTAEAERAGAFPRHHLTLNIRDGDDRIVEGGLNVRQSERDILALFLLKLLLLALFIGRCCSAACCCCRFRHGYVLAAAFFLFATVPLRGPFRVRALVCVRCPRTGRLRRWRYPRYEPISMSRLMFIETSLRRSPSTMPSPSITWRMRLTSSSPKSWTFFIGSTFASPRMRAERGLPIP